MAEATVHNAQDAEMGSAADSARRNDLNVVAIDFGSTSSAAAIFSQLSGVTWRIDPDQADVARKGILAILQDPSWPDPRLLDVFLRETVPVLPDWKLPGTSSGSAKVDVD